MGWRKGTRKEQNCFCGLKAKERSWGEEKNCLLVSVPRVTQLPSLTQGNGSRNGDQNLVYQQNGLSTRFLPLPRLRLGNYNTLQGQSRFEFCHVEVSTELSAYLQPSRRALSAARGVAKREHLYLLPLWLLKNVATAARLWVELNTAHSC